MMVCTVGAGKCKVFGLSLEAYLGLLMTTIELKRETRDRIVLELKLAAPAFEALSTISWIILQGERIIIFKDGWFWNKTTLIGFGQR